MKFLIAGLGNIGPDYTLTRHNIGFMVLDLLAEKYKLTFTSARYAWFTEYRFKGKIFILIKPTTFMNLSGKAINYWMKKFDIAAENLFVICDDIALPLGTVRIRAKGSDGGHNGLSDIIETLGTTDFARLRFGIGKDFVKGYQSDFVLGKWSKEELKIISQKIESCTEAVKCFGTEGLQNCMNKFNKG
jgi:peptidyl-tRNA hydrolase, PTH1 family